MEDTDELRRFREQWKMEVTLHQDEAVALYMQALDFEQAGNVVQGSKGSFGLIRFTPNIQ